MKPRYFLKCYIAVIMATALLCSFQPAFASTPIDGNEAPGRKMAKQAVKGNARWTTTDHSQHKVLQQDFKTGEEITKACISCHSSVETQFHTTIHWTWRAKGEKSNITYGKAGDSVNTFCLSGNGMDDKGCLKCHVGWNKKGMDSKINCLNCHNNSGFSFLTAFSDIKSFFEDGDPETNEIIPDIQEEIKDAVTSVAFPTRANCGRCHFYGGGGDGVKHGDLDSSMTEPNKKLDVHMGIDGQNFSCTRCHTTVDHHIAGRIYTNPAVSERRSLIDDDMAPKITCVSCHSDAPHKNDTKMNDHTDVVSCQACHIPTYARVLPTQMTWDWTTAGKLKDGKPYHEDGPLGKPIYKSIKGSFTWEKNVVPEYQWFNGSLKSTTVKDIIDPGQIIKISSPVGAESDLPALIYPFKIHRGIQPYDKINKTLAAPMLSGKNGFWTTFDMNDAIKHGNKALGIPYSGKFDYVKTAYAFPITHMVAPKENVVGCIECHTRKDGRLAKISGVFIPGRDHNSLINTIGLLAIFGTLGVIILHAIGRIVTGKNGKKET
ncbi:MAG: tetrathionate reductase family octaheme c-type cytochrome [Deltaproteobacteria bacterium]|nr:tetrathionate reductase family octaheme c-type cytochrome [Deltaproteobacteria bacterium]